MTGLIGWWPLHEYSGKAGDLSGNNRDASVSDGNPVRGVSGKGGLQSTFFTGNDAFGIDIPDLRDFTISVWVKHSSGDPDHAAGSGADEPYPRNWDFAPSYFQQDDTQGSGSSSYTISWDHPGGDEWHLVTVTKENSELRVFIDGSLVASDFNWTSAPLREYNHGAFIGKVHRDYAPNYDVTDWYKGGLCDFRIYNRAISHQEIQTLYKWGNGDYASPPNDRTDSSAVSRYAFDDDSDSSTAVDSWGNNTGSINGASYTSDAVREKALHFDGSNDSVKISSSELDMPRSKSVSAWVRMDGAASSEYQRIFQTGTSSSGRAYEFWIEDENTSGSFGRTVFRLNKDQSPSTKSANFTIPDFNYGQWYNCTSVYDYENGEMSIYINGVLRETVNYQQEVSSETDHHIGNWADAGARPWNGIIDDVRIYSRALSSSEVFELYQWGTRGRDMRKLTTNTR